MFMGVRQGSSEIGMLLRMQNLPNCGSHSPILVLSLSEDLFLDIPLIPWDRIWLTGWVILQGRGCPLRRVLVSDQFIAQGEELFGEQYSPSSRCDSVILHKHKHGIISVVILIRSTCSLIGILEYKTSIVHHFIWSLYRHFKIFFLQMSLFSSSSSDQLGLSRHSVNVGWMNSGRN